jgi:hypothetical protein
MTISSTTTFTTSSTTTGSNVMTRMIVMMASIFLLSASYPRNAVMRSFALSTTNQISTRSIMIFQPRKEQTTTTTTTTRRRTLARLAGKQRLALSSTASTTASAAEEGTTGVPSSPLQDGPSHPPPQSVPDMEDIVSLCKRRGIIFPSSDIYNGYAGFFDYGPLGAELKKNLKDAWWKHFVTQREDVVGLDSSIIHNPTTWKSSGTFSPSDTYIHRPI